MLKNIFILYNIENEYKKNYKLMKNNRRETKRINKRTITGEEVIFIFEKY
jgi:hypothetical protein